MKIAITGGKGGTGKSTIATALAIELAKKNKVMLVDCDVECPDDHIILSINRKKIKDVETLLPKFNQEKCLKCGTCAEVCKQNAIVFVKDRYPFLVSGQCNGCGACILACPSNAIVKETQLIGAIYQGFIDTENIKKVIKENFLLISGEIEVGCEATSLVVRATRDLGANFENNFDFLLVDTAAGTHCDVISAFLNVDLALAVTEPTPLGKNDLELILSLLEKLKISSKIIVNRSNIGDISLIKNVSEKEDIPIILEIPYEKRILKSYSKGFPIENESIYNLADSLRF